MTPTILPLDGIWKLGWFDGRRGDKGSKDLPEVERTSWIDAQVPGEVHRTLEAAGIIAPIEIGLGALGARWIDETVWFYSREFEVDASLIEQKAELVFERLELDARVFLNGELVGAHRNAFTQCRLDLSAKLIAGRNRLRVEINSGLFAVAERPAIGYRHSLDQGINKRHWLRTGQSQFSWDWSPRLLTVGITEPVRLEFLKRDARIVSLVPLVNLAPDHKRARVTCRVHAESDAPESAEVAVSLPELSISARKTVDLNAGESTIEIELAVDNPQLWWPVGLGAQPLFRVEAELSVDGAVADRASRRVGFRTIVVDQSPVSDGTLFKLVVNGVAVFAKGGNWVPLSLTPHPVDQSLLDRQLDHAIEANFNFLRVWGGGDYETEEFYDGCDERGILVWQDFVFACSRYPTTDREFLAEISAEATEQVRRLASHASLAVWSGNNEIAWIGLAPGWPGPLVFPEDGATRDQLIADHRFFEDQLPTIVAAEDPTRFYQPSSPWSPNDADMNAGHEGDQHPWKVGFDFVDFLTYRDVDARFPNEGGLLGSPSRQALLESLPEGQRSYDSFAWKAHDNQVAMSYPHRPLEKLVADWTGRRLRDLSIDEYVYWTGLIHGEALTEYIDNFRRRSSTTGAAVFWMYNDCWPTVRSWTIVDSRGRTNPSFHRVRHAFAPLRVLAVAEGELAAIYVSNDGTAAREVDLEWGIAQPAGGMDTKRRRVVVEPGAAVAVERVARDMTGVVVAMLRDGDEIVSRSRLLPGTFTSVVWSDPKIETSVAADGTATFVSSTYVLGVCLDLDGVDGPNDNFFDLFPGVPHSVRNGGRAPTVLFTGNSAGR